MLGQRLRRWPNIDPAMSSVSCLLGQHYSPCGGSRRKRPRDPVLLFLRHTPNPPNATYKSDWSIPDSRSGSDHAWQNRNNTPHRAISIGEAYKSGCLYTPAMMIALCKPSCLFMRFHLIPFVFVIKLQAFTFHQEQLIVLASWAHKNCMLSNLPTHTFCPVHTTLYLWEGFQVTNRKKLI